MKRCILYSDLDGTLIHKESISDENRQAVRRLIEAGGEFSIATGRSEVTAHPFVDQLPLTLPAILYNGAAVYDFRTKTFLNRIFLPRAVFEGFTLLARRDFPEMTIQAFTGGPAVLLSAPENTDPYIIREKQAVRHADRPQDCADCFKMVFYGQPDRLAELEAAFRQCAQEGYTCTYSAPFYLEVLPAGATKGSALLWLMERLGRDRDTVAAIGDFDNDVSMIQAAGLGAAPADAQPCAREAADVLTAPHTRHAVADLIERYMLPS